MHQVTRYALLSTLMATLAFGAGCSLTDQDDFIREGGTAPNPSGVLNATVLYVGPKPQCTYDGDTPVRVEGRVILFLFDYNNPPPPEGSASTAVNLIAQPGKDLFTLEDCAAKGADADWDKPIMRSLAVTWPSIELDVDARRSYQVRGFYDYDEDMNPFFSIRNLPTAGDVGGGAVESTPDPNATVAEPVKYTRIEFPSQKEAPDGVVVSGVPVLLGSRVWTERPAFKQSSVPLKSDNADNPLPDPTDENLAAAQVAIRESLHLDLTVATAADLPAVAREAAGMEMSFAPGDHAMYVTPVDANGDGVGDTHPLLTVPFAVPWLAPIVLIQRRPEGLGALIETRANVPAVVMVGTTDPLAAPVTAYVAGDTLEISVPPVGVLDLVPGNVACQIGYVPPGSGAGNYDTINPFTLMPAPTACQEIPTGRYSTNVIAGMAGGNRIDDPSSPTGYNFQASTLSGQAWSIPNELGMAEQMCDGADTCDALVPSQGVSQAVVVHDTNPDGSATQCAAGINPAPVPDACCDGVLHLCDVPLCGMQDITAADGSIVSIRRSPTKIVGEENGYGVPDCIPFPMPPSCCN